MEFFANKFGIIYVATNLINNKQYVGQTSRKLYERKSNHKNEKNTFPIHLAIKKYGINNFKLSRNLRTRLKDAIKNNQKSGSAVRDLGCTIPELKLYLESKFQSGMSWDNWSKTGWHIDHIRPLSSFNLTNRKEFLQACHYTNLQPLWAEENIRKGDKIL
jgi:hypothetical protein